MGNQNTSSIAKIASQSINKVDQQVPFNADENASWT